MTTVLLLRWTTLLQLKQGLHISLLHKAYIFVQICAIFKWKFITGVLSSEICNIYSMFTSEHVFQSLNINSPFRRRDQNKTSVICSNYINNFPVLTFWQWNSTGSLNFHIKRTGKKKKTQVKCKTLQLSWPHLQHPNHHRCRRHWGQKWCPSSSRVYYYSSPRDSSVLGIISRLCPVITSSPERSQTCLSALGTTAGVDPYAISSPLGSCLTIQAELKLAR